MDTVIRIAWVIYNLGSTVLIPVIILLIALALRLGFHRSVCSAVMIMASLYGVALMLNRIGSEINASATLFSEKFALASTPVVLSYQLSSAIAFSSSMVMLLLPIGLGLNLLLCLLRSCRTFNIDLWSYWHMALTGVLVQAVTDNTAHAFCAAGLHCLLTLLLPTFLPPAWRNPPE